MAEETSIGSGDEFTPRPSAATLTEDQKFASDIRKLTNELNFVIRQALQAGIVVQISVTNSMSDRIVITAITKKL